MVHSELVLKREQIELWKSWYSGGERPWFVVKSPDGIYCFPSYCNPNNDQQAINRVKLLREKYNEAPLEVAPGK